MSTCSDDTQDTDGEGDGIAPSDGPAERLVSRLVTNADGPDRRTVFPQGLSSVARMSTWLTANEDAFVDIEENR
jgi:hypothetical protein